MPRANNGAMTGLPSALHTITDMVESDGYPCLGARSVFHRNRATLAVYDTLGGPQAAGRMLSDLARFAEDTDTDAGFASFVAAFRGPHILDEEHFEQLLWAQLQQIASLDETPWNPQVSRDPADRHFAFSAAGTAYFVVGMHPEASRMARRTALPVLVFNLHEQFENLRRSGRYDRMRDTIRRRDKALQGNINPMVTDHGRDSEARQYSGRRVEDRWQAPFQIKDTATRAAQ